MADQTTLDSFAEFNAFRTEMPSLEAEEWNEADTRSKLIDRLIIRCLDWPESSIRRELIDKNKRLDYLLSVDREQEREKVLRSFARKEQRDAEAKRVTRIVPN